MDQSDAGSTGIFGLRCAGSMNRPLIEERCCWLGRQERELFWTAGLEKKRGGNLKRVRGSLRLGLELRQLGAV
eukprot:9492907-Pyramimonas_sp.AAC.1